MKRGLGDKIITSIDIGTTKISVLVGHVTSPETISIIGFARSVSEGLKKGVVVDVAKTVAAIKTAVKEAELVSGVAIKDAYIGVSGAHIKTTNSQGMIPIKNTMIRNIDVHQALMAARAIAVEKEYQILHVLPQYFIIDERERVNQPVGMHAIRLEVKAHIIMGAISSVQNLITCCQLAGITVKDVVLEQLASAYAVLTHDERELGVAMLDIGGGTSDLALYADSAIRHTMVLPVAGNQVTNDIAIGLHIPLHEAERIKKEWGNAYITHAAHNPQDFFEVQSIQGNQRIVLSRGDLAPIIYPRMHELFSIIHTHIARNELLPTMQTGLVITGGGSLLDGVQDVAQSIFKMSVRIGYPHVSHSLPEILINPMYATGYGLLLYALKKEHEHQNDPLFSGPRRLFDRMRAWVVDFF